MEIGYGSATGKSIRLNSKCRTTGVNEGEHNFHFKIGIKLVIYTLDLLLNLIVVSI